VYVCKPAFLRLCVCVFVCIHAGKSNIGCMLGLADDIFVCCNVLQCVVVCCSVLQCVAVCYSALQSVAECCNVLQRVVVYYSVLQSMLQCVAAYCGNCTNGGSRIYDWL